MSKYFPLNNAELKELVKKFPTPFYLYDEKAIEDATELLKENVSPEIIAKCVKLPLEQVLDIQKQITVNA